MAYSTKFEPLQCPVRGNGKRLATALLAYHNCLYRGSVFATPLPSLTPLVGMGEQLSPVLGRGPSAL
jgi:hypothetical protein